MTENVAYGYYSNDFVAPGIGGLCPGLCDGIVVSPARKAGQLFFVRLRHDGRPGRSGRVCDVAGCRRHYHRSSAIAIVSDPDSLPSIHRDPRSVVGLFRADCFAAGLCAVAVFAGLCARILRAQKCRRAGRVLQSAAAGDHAGGHGGQCVLLPVRVGNHGADDLLPGELRT